MVEIYKKLADLNYWANEKLRITIEQLNREDLETKTPYGLLRELIIHLFNSINHWFDYIDIENYIPRKDSDINYFNWVEIKKLWIATDERFMNFVLNINDLDEFNNRFSYHEDPSYSIAWGELFLHLSHHSYYHRGQIAMLLRQNNLIKAPITDAEIFFSIKMTRK